MFTGIIETTGTLRACDTHGDDSTLTIASQAFDFARCALGDSIAVNGVCLTATALGADWFSADVSAETLRLTTLGDLNPGAAVNLERALTLATPWAATSSAVTWTVSANSLTASPKRAANASPSPRRAR